jgi:phospholipid transport system substrate-binding protein
MGKALAAWLMVAGALAAPGQGPRELVEASVARVIQVLHEGGNDRFDPSYPRHRAEIRRIAHELFDFDEMTRRALSRHWVERSAQERAEFVGLFTDLLERSYIGKIEAYSGEKIVYLGEAIDGAYATVRSRVTTKRRTDTALDYRLYRTDGRWKVYDVLIDGVSFVSTYRSEFNRIIRLSSYSSLVDQMRKRRIDTVVVGTKPS